MAKWNNIIAFAGSTTDNTGSVDFDGNSTITGSLIVTQDITASGVISASGNISGSSLHINGTTKNIIASTNGFRISSYTDLKYLESTGNTLQWRTNNDSIFELRSQNGSADDVYIHLEHADAPLTNVSIGTNQAAGSFFIARDEGFDTNKDFTITGSNGYVGINEPNPTERLSVNGNISASGTIVGSNLSGTNTGDITLSGTPDYITISNQTITRNQINLTSDVTGQLPSANLGTITSAKISDVDAFSQSGTYASLRAQGTTAADVGLGNVENTALSTYTGNGGALDNQYIANGAGYTTNTGTVDASGTPANNQLAIFTDSNTIEGDSNLTWDGSTFTINGTGSVDVLQVDDKLQGNGSGFQFFAFNEDTIKVKFANWYSSNDRQYGMGQLWFETWFAAIDNGANRDARRIGFYLEEPDAGSTDSGTPGQHPSNARFYVDINGAYLSGSFQASGDITGSALQLGNLGAANEILIVGANTEVTSSNLLAIDTVNERVGIGTSTPQVKLDLVGESSGEAQVRVAQHDNSTDGPDIRFFKSHGTAAVPSSVANNDYIGAVNAFAYDGSTYIQSGFFGFQADGTDGDSKFGLRTRVDGTLADRIAIDSAGDVDIAGNISASGDVIGATGSFDVIFGGTF